MTLRPAPLPTLEQLQAHLDAYGPEGIMDSAAHLSEAELVTLDAACKRARKAQRFPKRRIGRGRR